MMATFVLLVGLTSLLCAVGTRAADATSDVTFTSGLFAIDLGASAIKVAAPKFNTTIDIVLNEQSRRKTPAIVGFRKRNRYVGEEARSLAPRFPSLMVPAPHLYGGHTLRNAKALRDVLFDGNTRIVEDAARWRSPAFVFEAQNQKHLPTDDDATASPEELTASLIEYAAEITTADLGETAAAAVIAVPHATSLKQRLAIKAAAELAGIRLLNLTHSLTAAALQYGISLGGFGNDTVYVTLVDVGAAQVQAGLFRYDPPAGRVAVAEALGTLTTVRVASLPLGGSASDVDRCIARFIDARIAEEHGKTASILNAAPAADAAADPKAALLTEQRRFALLRAAANAKETMSVSPSADVSVEAALDSGDYATTLLRADVEPLCLTPHGDRIARLAAEVSAARHADWAPIAERLTAARNAARENASAPPTPATAAETESSDAPLGAESDRATPLSDEEPSAGGSGAAAQPVDDTPPTAQFRVELVGAGSRVPAVSTAVAAALEAETDAKTIGRRLNTDDSVALGAAYISARHSAFIRVRGFRVVDLLPCAHDFHVSVDDPLGFPKSSGAARGAKQLAPTRLTTKAARSVFASCNRLPCHRSVSVLVADATAPATSDNSRGVSDTVSFTVSTAADATFCGASTPVEGAWEETARHVQTVTLRGIEDAVATALNHTTLSLRHLNVTTRVELALTTDGVVWAGDPMVRVSKPKAEKETPKQVDGSDGQSADGSSSEAADGGDASENSQPAKKKKKAKAGKKKKPAADAKPTADKRHTYAALTFAGAPDGTSAAAAAPAWFFVGAAAPMSREQHTAAAASLNGIKATERALRAAAIKKNDLETLLLLERADKRHEANSAATQAFASVAAWLETTDDNTPAADYESQHAQLLDAIAASPPSSEEL